MLFVVSIPGYYKYKTVRCAYLSLTIPGLGNIQSQ